MRSSPTVVDLYSGCGGFGLGAEQAGFRVIAAVDIDSTLQESYRLNFPGVQVVNDDVSKMDAGRWAELIGDNKPDGVIGGPPCQGFSRIGRRDKADPRNSLIRHFFRNVLLLGPKFFVMENVEGLLDAGNRDALDSALAILGNRYRILGPIVISAADFGAPTVRRRVIVVGFDPDHIESVKLEHLMAGTAARVSVSDAIADLPTPLEAQGHICSMGWKRYPEVDHGSSTLSAYSKQMRRRPTDDLGWDVALAHHALGETSGHSPTTHSDTVSKRFGATKPGTVEQVSRYPRLDWDGLCPTLRAGTGSDKGSFQAMRPIHPSQPRVITVREAARLQGFPDWFSFSPAKWHSFRMIGNSVSPLVARAIMEGLKLRLSAGAKRTSQTEATVP